MKFRVFALIAALVASGCVAIGSANAKSELLVRCQTISQWKTPGTDVFGLKRDPWCREYFIEPAPETTTGATTIQPLAGLERSGNPGQAFNLHSRPGSKNIIYLDFDGIDWQAGNWWQDAWGLDLVGSSSPGFDRDGDPSTFTTAERLDIIDVWQIVAEDFAVFDVDVTTEEPTGARLVDFQNNGAVALILSDTNVQNACQCGGVAHLDVYQNGDPFLRPSLNFMRFGDYRTTTWDIAEIIAHEVGHTMGLVHDGTSEIEYYLGHPLWTPIMGAGRGAGVATWSDGGYPDALTRAPQPFIDDYLTIDRYTPLLADAVGNNAANALELSVAEGFTEYRGIIERRDDVDWFSFTVNEGDSGVWNFLVEPVYWGANLDPELQLLSSSQLPLAVSNPEVPVPADYQFGVATQGFDANISRNLLPGTYYLRLDGVGQGNQVAGIGYNDYGSRGNYVLQIIPPTPAVTGVSSLSGGVGKAITVSGLNLAYTTSVKIGGVSAPFNRTLDDKLIVGVPVGAVSGAISVSDVRGRTMEFGQSFTVLNESESLELSSVSSRLLGLGETHTLVGNNLGGISSLVVGGVAEGFLALNANTIVWTVDSNSRAGVIVANGPSGIARDDTGVRLKFAPQFDALASVKAGDSVEIAGRNLLTTQSVSIGGEVANFDVISDTKLEVTIPRTATSGPMFVTNSYGNVSATIEIEPLDVVVGSGISKTVRFGAAVTLSGQNMDLVTSVTFAGREVPIVLSTQSSLRFVAPSAMRSGVVELLRGDDVVWTSSSLSLIPQAPQLSSVSSVKPRVGVTVVIRGKNFVAPMTAYFGGVAAKVVRVSGTSIKVVVPAKAKSGWLQLKTPGGMVKYSKRLTIIR